MTVAARSDHSWRLDVRVELERPCPAGGAARRVAAHFGLGDGREVLYDGFRLTVRPRQVVLVTGPSGSGKTLLLREARRQWPDAVALDLAGLHRRRRAAIECLPGPLGRRLELLSRCGLAEPTALLTPATALSGGQQYRLALARALHQAGRRTCPTIVLADEFGGALDRPTAWMLARQIRTLADRTGLAFLLASPHDWLAEALAPDVTIVKPLAQPPRVLEQGHVRQAWAGVPDPSDWPIRPGCLGDYHALGWCHYAAGPPAAHLRVWAIDAPPELGDPRGDGAAVAAVCVVSPPVPNVRGRNAAFPGRYTSRPRDRSLRRLNAEIECISRVVVHPVYRAAGLGVRLARHARATAATPLVESLAAMGAVHPLFERAGFRALSPSPLAAARRLASAVEVVGLEGPDLASLPAVRAMLAEPGPAGRFLQRELDRFARKALGGRALERLARRGADPLPAILRKAATGYVYYFAH